MTVTGGWRAGDFVHKEERTMLRRMTVTLTIVVLGVMPVVAWGA